MLFIYIFFLAGDGNFCQHYLVDDAVFGWPTQALHTFHYVHFQA